MRPARARREGRRRDRGGSRRRKSAVGPRDPAATRAGRRRPPAPWQRAPARRTRRLRSRAAARDAGLRRGRRQRPPHRQHQEERGQDLLAMRDPRHRFRLHGMGHEEEARRQCGPVSPRRARETGGATNARLGRLWRGGCGEKRAEVREEREARYRVQQRVGEMETERVRLPDHAVDEERPVAHHQLALVELEERAQRTHARVLEDKDRVVEHEPVAQGDEIEKQREEWRKEPYPVGRAGRGGLDRFRHGGSLADHARWRQDR